MVQKLKTRCVDSKIYVSAKCDASKTINETWWSQETAEVRQVVKRCKKINERYNNFYIRYKSVHKDQKRFDPEIRT
jgi:phage FluMu protein Com